MILTQKHKEDLAQFEAKSAEYRSFLKAHEADLGDAKVYAEGEALRNEVKALRGAIEAHVKGARLHADASDFESFLSEPEQREAKTYSAKKPFEVIGTTEAGYASIDAATKSLLEEIGPGVLSREKWEASKQPEYKAAFLKYIRHGERALTGQTLKTLEVGLDPQGGALAPADWIARLIERKPTPTRVAGMTTTITTGRDAVVMPKVNYNSASDDSSGNLYTTGFRATWTEEVPTSDTQALVNDASLVGSVRIDNFTAMIEGVLTNNMVEDAAFDVQGWVQGKFQETVDLLRDNMVLNGSGVQQPTGIIPSCAASPADGQVQAFTSGTSGGISPDDIFTLAYDVPEQYEDNLRFLFNKTSTMKALRKLKDSQNRYLFGVGYQDSGLAVGKPVDLVGYPFQYSGFMPNVSSGNFSVLFGDLTGYYLTMRLGFYVQALREIQARRNQIVLLGRVRFGGQVVEPWKLRALKIQ